MRTKTALLSVTLGALVSAAALASSQGAISAITTFTKALNGASSLSATYTVQTIGGIRNSFQLDLKKPNLARLDLPTKLVIADGKNVTIFDKQAKTYYTQAQTDGELFSYFASEDLNTFAPFFYANAIKPVDAIAKGSVVRRGQTLNAVEATLDRTGRKIATYFLSPSDNLPRQAQFDLDPKDPSRRVTRVLNTSALEVNNTLTDKTFAFSPPDGARQLSLDEVAGMRWLSNLDDALAIAKEQNKRVLVVINEANNDECRKLQEEVFDNEAFQKFAGRKLILCKLDLDNNPKQVARLSITEAPTVVLLDKVQAKPAKTVGGAGMGAGTGTRGGTNASNSPLTGLAVAGFTKLEAFMQFLRENVTE